MRVCWAWYGLVVTFEAYSCEMVYANGVRLGFKEIACK